MLDDDAANAIVVTNSNKEVKFLWYTQWNVT